MLIQISEKIYVNPEDVSTLYWEDAHGPYAPLGGRVKVRMCGVHDALYYVTDGTLGEVVSYLNGTAVYGSEQTSST